MEPIAVSLTKPEFIAICIAGVMFCYCTGTEIYDMRKEQVWTSLKAHIAFWLLPVVVVPAGVWGAGTVAENMMHKQKIVAAQEKREAGVETERMREQKRIKRERDNAKNRAKGAEYKDREVAAKQLAASLGDDWEGILRVLRADGMSIDPKAKVVYVVNALKHKDTCVIGMPDQKECPLTKISINQNRHLMELSLWHEELAAAIAICIDPMKTDPWETFAEQKRAGKYDPKKYLAEKTE